MERYCERCKLPCEGGVCPQCGNEALGALLPEAPCFLTEQQAVWAAVLGDVLKQRDIPYMDVPVQGAGLTTRLGSAWERYRFYVPYEHLPAAMEQVEALFSGAAEAEEDRARS